MKTVILCGGLGTRLRQETEFRPKPMVEIGGKPILWHIMKLYAHHGFKDFVMCLGYQGNIIKEYFLNYQAMNNDFSIHLGSDRKLEFCGSHDEHDFRVTLADTGLETMTGGRLKRAARHIDGDVFMLTYGDGIADVNIRELVRFHSSHGKLATLTTVRPLSRFGVIEIEAGGQVRRFREKPELDGWINGGFFVFNRRFLDYLDSTCVLEREPLEKLAEEEQLIAYPHEGFWYGMDTYRDFLYLNELWEKGKASWKVWE